MKKVLIITYYWIPGGGSGVQRWIKFVKYLRDFGWEPVIYTPENPEYPSIDNSFDKDIPENMEVIKATIWEPYNIYRILSGKKSNTVINAGFIREKNKKSLADKISYWLRGNLLIPDPRIFWVRPSIKKLAKHIENSGIEAIITTGPPHSMHLIGNGLKKKFPNIPWIADFRDPWTSVYYFKDMKIGYLAHKVHQLLERKIVRGADQIIVVSEGMKQEFERLHAKDIQIITNGYDTETITNDISLDKKFSISYLGLLTERQNPLKLWQVLAELCSESDEIKNNLEINLIGKIDHSAIETINAIGLGRILNYRSYIPHDEAIIAQRKSQVLLLLLLNQPNTDSILTGKLFEYLAAKRPIIGIGSTTGDAAKLLDETQAGVMIAFDDKTRMKNHIATLYAKFKEGKLTADTASITNYSRKELTNRLSDLLNKLTDK